MTRVAQILAQYGVSVTWKSRQTNGSFTSNGEIPALIGPIGGASMWIEPGITEELRFNIYTEAAIQMLDRIEHNGVTYEVQAVLPYVGFGESFYVAEIRRLNL